MALMVTGLIIFFAVHLIPLSPAKAALQGKLGEKGYKGFFAISAIIGLGLIIWGFTLARGSVDESEILYYPPSWGRHATMLLVLISFILLAIFIHKGRLRVWLKFPLLLAIIFWSAGHLLSNGAMPDVVLFSTFLVYAVVNILIKSAHPQQVLFTPKPKHDFIAPLAGVVMFAIALFLHPYLIGVSVINM